jgi:predicted RNase H-like nuclease (RuvC/YqgF family)
LWIKKGNVVLKQAVSLARTGVRALADALDTSQVRTERRTEKFDRAWVGQIESQMRDLREEHEQVLAGAGAMTRDRDEWKRKAEEYYRMIEGIIGERDQWKKMWFDDSAGHLEAQAYLDAAIEAARKMFLQLLQQLNELRKEKGLGPVGVDLKDTKAIVDGTRKRIERQHNAAPNDTDWVAKREEVAGSGKAETTAEPDLKSPLDGPTSHSDLPDLP